jgi:hypothetical protein
MKVLAVYVGQESQVNLRHGLSRGIWGFRDRAKPDKFDTLRPGDLILLASGYSGGSPRTSAEEWKKHSMCEIRIAEISMRPLIADEPEWPDEKDLPYDERYIHRIKFDPKTVDEWTDVRLDDREMLSAELAEDIRKSAIQRGKGFIEDARDLPRRVSFTAEDCKLFARYPDPVNWRSVTPDDQARFKSIWARLKQISTAAIPRFRSQFDVGS